MSDPAALFAAHLDDTLDAAQHAELTAWLRADEANLRAFTDALLFEQQIREAAQAESLRGGADAFLVEDSATQRGDRRARGPRRQWWRLARAACLTLLIAGGMWWRLGIAPERDPWVAEVVQMRGAPVAGSAPMRTGGRVPAGRLALSAGAVDLVFRNGVRVLFEGPGELEILGPMRAMLHRGQAVVRVPENARGFQLETPSANVVDLGTEFAVKAGPGLSTDVQVYEGAVVTTPKSALASGGFPQRIEAGEAVRFSPETKSAPQSLVYSPERFVRRLPPDVPVELEESFSHFSDAARFEEIVITRPEQPIVADGDLAEWSDAGRFRSERAGVPAEFVEGRMRYDAHFLYLAAHIGDPAPMRNVIDPATDGESGWRGGGLQVRLATDRALGWPVDANSPAYYQFRRIQPDAAHLANATSGHLAHLTLWHHAPSARSCLHVAYGMDFHGGVVNPPGYRAAFREDAGGRGYTLEYAIPWSLLGVAENPPRPGETLAMSWTAHWSDAGGRLWRGQLVEIRNASEPLRIHTWERAATWGRAVFR